MQHQQLLAKGQIFEDKAAARTESNENPAEEMPKEYDHGKNLIETRRLRLVSKSLILRVHEVLTGVNRQNRNTRRNLLPNCYQRHAKWVWG
jgi:hypothetical protein